MLSGMIRALGDNYHERQKKQKLINEKFASLKDLLRVDQDLDKTSGDTLEQAHVMESMALSSIGRTACICCCSNIVSRERRLLTVLHRME